ncbi:uncharacterized protein LOC119458928 isoform X1 [Dermacentor silvarum]|uniref:uncharacterized protein LOC119458928 isoform X1 n=1 Tax=Dermacentor silvarum TaxID=543639 RepID=UPI0018974189|nr:uncharacterized protein LOC119458928 isoform X1 [Dermacentor silvarum]
MSVSAVCSWKRRPAIFVFCSVVFVVLHAPGTKGHGRLIEPPARNSMWRISYNTPPNFEDTELFCGGIKAQWEDNGGRCGVCGDNYAHPRPRRHETGNMYARNVTVRRYAPGQLVDLVVDLETNHLGHFEFALCPRASWQEAESEECFDMHPLTVVTASGPARRKSAFYCAEPKTRYRLPTAANGLYMIQVQLPEKLTCEYCVLRWHWRSANNWGDCGDGKMALGCGPQETYRNCADVAIGHRFGLRGPLGANAVPKRFGATKPRKVNVL